MPKPKPKPRRIFWGVINKRHGVVTYASEDKEPVMYQLKYLRTTYPELGPRSLIRLIEAPVRAKRKKRRGGRSEQRQR